MTSSQMEKHFKGVKATITLPGAQALLSHKDRRGESDGALEAQLAALGLTQHGAQCPGPISPFFLTQYDTKLAESGKELNLKDSGTMQRPVQVPNGH